MKITLPIAGLILYTTPAYAGICPLTGNDTDCGTIINITNLGAIISHTGQGPYDATQNLAGDDTLIGVHNLSSVPLHSFAVSSGGPIFGFDGDGPSTYHTPGNPNDPTGYAGPGVTFTNASLTNGVVNFSPAIPTGGTAYFGLETALTSATSLGDLVNNSISVEPQAPCRGNPFGCGGIEATFTPNGGKTLAEAEQILGIKNFDWVQMVTNLPDPSPYATADGIPITSASVPFNDPVPGGYSYMDPADPAHHAYPYYYDPTYELPREETESGLPFFDRAADPCLAGGTGKGCGGLTAPPGSFLSFRTELVGIQNDGQPMDLGVGFSWTSDLTGSIGGAAVPYNIDPLVPVDPGGFGGVTLESVREITNADIFGQINISNINEGQASSTIPEPSTWLAITIGFLSLGLLKRKSQ